MMILGYPKSDDDLMFYISFNICKSNETMKEC